VDDLWATESEDVGLIVRAISFQEFPPMWSWSTNVTDRQTERQTDGQTDDMWSQYRGLHCRASRGKYRNVIRMPVATWPTRPVCYKRIKYDKAGPIIVNSVEFINTVNAGNWFVQDIRYLRKRNETEALKFFEKWTQYTVRITTQLVPYTNSRQNEQSTYKCL